MTAVPRDPRLRQIKWRDLVGLGPGERLWEMTLPLPWLALAIGGFAAPWPALGGVGAVFFFLTGLRLSHNAQHYALGVTRRAHDLILFGLSVLMLGSMHAIQTTHLHHHRHCLDDEDIEAAHVRHPAWRVLLTGWLFPLRMHRAAYRLADRRRRRWILAELGAMAGWITVACVFELPALRWFVGAMLVGEAFTAYFAVWIVHRGCTHDGQIARTQRGWLRNLVSYAMFYHLEHHLFPAVPTCHLPELARRLDAAAPEYREMQVI